MRFSDDLYDNNLVSKINITKTGVQIDPINVILKPKPKLWSMIYDAIDHVPTRI